MEFPLFVYQCPGSYLGPSGATYKTELVENAAELKAALSAGWYVSLADAVDCVSSGHESDDAEVDAPPTRAEMLEQAEKLGLKVDKRWSDETLLAKIDAALADLSTDCVE